MIDPAMLDALLNGRHDSSVKLVGADHLEEAGEGDVARLFMYSCGENLNTPGKLRDLGCPDCKRWAELTMEIICLRKKLEDNPLLRWLP